MIEKSKRLRVELPDSGKGFYATVLEKGSGRYIVRPLNSKVSVLLKGMLQKKGALRARVGGKFAGYLIYRNGNFLLSAYLEERGIRRERVTLYLKREPVLTAEASIKVMTDAFNRKYEVYESQLLEKLPDGAYVMQDGRRGKKVKRFFIARA